MSGRTVRYASADGLSLFARDLGPESDPLPLLCLPGLTRNSRDFETIAHLAAAHRMILADFRGRGQSGHAHDAASYRVDIEMVDTFALLDHLGIARVAIIGTSRGGLVAMAMASAQPHRLAGVLLNDIGPRLEKEGLLRIRSYVGRPLSATTWDDAAAMLARTNAGFDGVTPDGWMAFARRVFRDEAGLPVLDYDPAIAHSLPSQEQIATGEIPELWPLFEALLPMPAAVLRGSGSDLLSAATAAEMMRRHPDFETIEIPGRGHAPFLDEPESLGAIDRWLERMARRHMQQGIARTLR